MGMDTYSELVAQAPAGERERFIRQTYLHLAGAVLAFIVVEWLLLQWSGADALVYAMTRRYVWLLVLLGFMAASSVAERWARSDTSQGTQYLGLGLYVARLIAEFHGGAISARNLASGGGVAVTASFRLA